jgi:protoporphyrinogen oxidase
MIAILGGGIAGISAGYHLGLKGTDYTIYEKNESWGGLCDNFTIGGGFRFDHFIHLSFTSSDYVQKLFASSSDFHSHRPLSTNYYKGLWLKHPVQNHLFPLSAKEKVAIIQDFIQRTAHQDIKNYQEWLRSQFGNYFSQNFPEVYTKKYWTLPAENLMLDWLEGRFSLPPLDKLLLGSFIDQEENFYYADEMRYPKKGGYKRFLEEMATASKVETSKEVVLIDLENKWIEFTDSSQIHFDKLISSIPLPELVKLIKDVPASVVEASEKLLCTSGQLVSLGFNRPDIPRDIWFYMYDTDILPSRAYSPSIKSPDNVPSGKSSLQFETYFSRKSPRKLSGGSLIEHVVQKGGEMGLFQQEDVEVSDYREAKYANVVFDNERESNLKFIHHFLNESNISYAGRFGEWDYLWSDQSLLSGRDVALKLDLTTTGGKR